MAGEAELPYCSSLKSAATIVITQTQPMGSEPLEPVGCRRIQDPRHYSTKAEAVFKEAILPHLLLLLLVLPPILAFKFGLISVQFRLLFCHHMTLVYICVVSHPEKLQSGGESRIYILK